MTIGPDTRKKWRDLKAASDKAFKAAWATPEYKSAMEADHALELFEENLPEDIPQWLGKCEHCGVPLFEGDDLLFYEEGEITCKSEGNPTGEVGPCYSDGMEDERP